MWRWRRRRGRAGVGDAAAAAGSASRAAVRGPRATLEPGIELNRAAETRLHLNRNAMAAYGLSARETFVASRCWFKSASFFP
jgi:hypothetical protein